MTSFECEQPDDWEQQNSPMRSQHQWLREYLSGLLKLCQVNLRSKTLASAQVPGWSRWAQLFFYYFTLKLITAQKLQHDYNNILYKLEQLASNNNTTSSSELKQRLVRQTGYIETLGNPYYELGFALEPAFLNILTINLLVYTLATLIVSYHFKSSPIHISLLGLLLDCQLERGLVTSQVLTVVDNLANSFLAAAHPTCARATSPMSWDHQQQQSRSKSRLFEELKRLARYDCVQPLNRHEAWLDRLFELCTHFVAMNNLASIPFIVGLLVLVPLTNTLLKFELHTSPRDLLFGAELLVYSLLGQQAVCFYITLLFMTCIDQIKYALELDASLGQLVRDIRGDLNGLYDGTRPLGFTSNQNLKLALALVQYRLFKDQIRSTQSLVGIAGGITFCLMILMPLLGRAYISYLNLNERWLVVMCSLLFVVCCDCIIIPNCYLNARCLGLLRHLSSLLAHVIDLDSSDLRQTQNEFRPAIPPSVSKRPDGHKTRASSCHARCHSRPHAFDDHLIWLLRRELSDQSIVMTKFETNAFFLRLTYTDLLGVHFWCALVLASLLMADTSGGTHATGNFFFDSLVAF